MRVSHNGGPHVHYVKGNPIENKLYLGITIRQHRDRNLKVRFLGEASESGLLENHKTWAMTCFHQTEWKPFGQLSGGPDSPVPSLVLV